MNRAIDISSQSFLTRNESAALKGFFMLLIILGHLRGVSYPVLKYLYCFHVQCFFILPFLYPVKAFTSKNILNLALKLLWPFVLLYFVLCVCGVFVFHTSYFQNPSELIPGIPNQVLGIWSFITGGITLIDKFSGTQFLWFLPCFFSMSVIRMWYYANDINLFQKALLFITGIVCYVVYSVLAYDVPILPQLTEIILQAISPLSVLQGLGFFTLGITSIWLIKKRFGNNSYISWSVIIILTLAFWFFNDNQIIFRILRFVFPAAFFLAVYSVRIQFAKSKILQNIGKRSLAVYLFHPFLCIVFGMMIPENLLSNWWVVCLQFIVILVVSYYLAVIVEKISFFRKLLFPEGEDFGLLKR